MHGVVEQCFVQGCPFRSVHGLSGGGAVGRRSHECELFVSVEQFGARASLNMCVHGLCRAPANPRHGCVQVFYAMPFFSGPRLARYIVFFYCVVF